MALQDYEGAVVLVSHDRHLLRVVADELLLVHQGRVTSFDGDLEDYARWLATSGAPPAAGTAKAPASAGLKAANGSSATARATPEVRKQRKRAQAERRAALGPLKAALAEQERELERLLARRGEVERELALPPAQPEQGRQRLSELMQQQAQLSQLIQGLESAWVEAAARLEALAAQQQGVD